MEQYTYIGFLIMATIALSGFIVWLVKKVIHIMKDVIVDNTKAYQELKFSIEKLGISIDNNIEATKELRQSIKH